MFNLKITKMKKLFSLVSLLVLIGTSVNVMGADTGRTPETGSTHTYSVSTHVGSTYAWSLTVAVDGTGTDLIGSVVTGDGSTDNTIDLTWDAPVSGVTYYLHVVETASNGCTNHKAFAIQPTTLQLDIVSMTDAFAANTIGTEADYCAKDVNVLSWEGVNVNTEANAQNFNYDYGTTYLYYRVEAKNYNYASLAWKPTITLTNTNVTGSLVSLKYGTSVPSVSGGPQVGYTTITDGTEFTVAAGSQYIYIEVAVNNQTTLLSGNEGTTAQNILATLSGKDNNDNNSTLINGTLAVGNDSATDNIKARPSTGVITAP